MSQFTTPVVAEPSAQASLAALVAHLKARGIFDDLRQGVHLAQKTVKDSPQDKVQDILLALLAGTHSLVQLNTLLRDEPALQPFTSRFFIKPPPEAYEPWSWSSSFWEPRISLAMLLARSGPRPAHHLGSTCRQS